MIKKTQLLLAYSFSLKTTS